tara:strand:- start:1842 stop:2102 length:261 start_codon:yes stop_codon:yes gene_type:complete
MGIFDEAWKSAIHKKTCHYCGEKATRWRGGQFFCDLCYDEVIVKGKKKKEFSAPPYKKRGGSENSAKPVKKKKQNKIKVDRYRFIK